MSLTSSGSLHGAVKMADVSRDNEDRSINASDGAAVINNTEHSKLLPWLMLCCILSAAAVVLSVITSIACYLIFQEQRQIQVQVMDHNALLIREGLAQPTDEVYGPAGNLEYKPHKRK